MSNIPENVGQMDIANDLLGDRDALRVKLHDDGYLYFRGMVSREALGRVRDDVTRTLADVNWIEGGEDRLEAVASGYPFIEGEKGYFRAHDRLQKLESFHALPHHSSIAWLMREVMGESAWPHPLSIIRLVFPRNEEVTTPPHQDFPNNQGTQNLTACWIPLSDVSRERGPLAVLKGSNRYGQLPVEFALGPGQRTVVMPETDEELEWVTTDYRFGDCLLFPSLTVHTALPNRDPDRMRLSVDYRFQLEGEELVESVFQPHFNRLTWEDIYADWESDRLKYYWKSKNYIPVPWDERHHKLTKRQEKAAWEQAFAFNGKRLNKRWEKIHNSGHRTAKLPDREPAE